MVRAPCCEKMGLKKGPWTPEEDHILVNHIKLWGHGNWRALSKQAGLLRCGKSCRLRWINYLRPDIKRGNVTREEEDTIIKLHEVLGNRWSAIAARLPGRTDNEIKNVWHTHLKKRFKKQQEPVMISNHHHQHRPVQVQSPPPQEYATSSDMSSAASSTTKTCMKMEPSWSENNDCVENFWAEVLSPDTSIFDVENNHHFSAVAGADPVLATVELESPSSDPSLNMDFWYNLFTKAGDFSEMLPKF